MSEALVDTRKEYMIYMTVIGVLGIVMCGTTYFFDFKELH
jgi:hypothetical protein